MNCSLSAHLGALRRQRIGQESRHWKRARVKGGNRIAVSRQTDARLCVDRAAIDDAMKRDARVLMLDRDLSSDTGNNLVPKLELRRCEFCLKLRILNRAVPIHRKVRHS